MIELRATPSQAKPSQTGHLDLSGASNSRSRWLTTQDPLDSDRFSIACRAPEGRGYEQIGVCATRSRLRSSGIEETHNHEDGQQKVVQRGSRKNEGEKLSRYSGIANLAEHLSGWIQSQSVESSLCDSE